MKTKLAPLHKIFLTANGSITRILEAIFGEIQVKTIAQKIIKANKKLAKELEIDEGNEVNYREVVLVSKKEGKPIVYAISFAPIKRIEKKFREEIMKKDLPIGKIMEKLKIEARREIRKTWAKKADKKTAQLLCIPEGEILLERSYVMIRKGKIMMQIKESIPWSFLEE